MMHADNPPMFEVMYASRRHIVDFLRAFAAMRHTPNWRQVGFEEDDLGWIASVWEHAAIAAAGNTRLRDACNREAERYTSLRQGLVDGMVERQEPGVVFLCDKDDWPHPKVLKGAIRALRHAQMGRLQ